MNTQEVKISQMGKWLIAAWFLNALILIVAWWGGYYLMENTSHTWIEKPLHAVIVTHSIIKILVTLFIVFGMANKSNWRGDDNYFWKNNAS